VAAKYAEVCFIMLGCLKKWSVGSGWFIHYKQRTLASSAEISRKERHAHLRLATAVRRTMTTHILAPHCILNTGDVHNSTGFITLIEMTPTCEIRTNYHKVFSTLFIKPTHNNLQRRPNLAVTWPRNGKHWPSPRCLWLVTTICKYNHFILPMIGSSAQE